MINKSGRLQTESVTKGGSVQERLGARERHFIAEMVERGRAPN